MAELRQLLQSKFPEAHAAATVGKEPPWDTHLPCLDAAGLRRGAILEVVAAARNAGAGLLIASLLDQPVQVRQPVALVDGCDTFDPGCITAAARERLLWLRCQDINDALRATDLLLRDGNIPLILLDLQFCPPRLLQAQPSSSWHRLRFLAEKSGTALCVFSPCRAVGCARTRLILESTLTLEALARPRTELARTLPSRVERMSSIAAPASPHVVLAN
jgi:hypothetical protein